MNKNEKLNVRNYGSLLGATVYRIVPEIVDLDYKKKVEDNKLRLTKPIYRFVPKKINITKTSLELGLTVITKLYSMTILSYGSPFLQNCQKLRMILSWMLLPNSKLVTSLL